MNLQLVVIAFFAFGAAAASAQVTTSDTAYQHGMQAYEQGHYAEAETFFRDALDQAKEFGEIDPRFESALKSLAAVFESERSYTEAGSFYQHALALEEQTLGPEHPELARLLNNLGTIREREGNYSQAEPLYKRALTIWEKAPEANHRGLAITLCNLAHMYHVQGGIAPRRICCFWRTECKTELCPSFQRLV